VPVYNNNNNYYYYYYYYHNNGLGVEITDMRKGYKVGETIERVIAVCSSICESAYSETQPAGKNDSQQTAAQCKLRNRNTLPYCRYKPEPVLESANMICIGTGVS
jgi:hypothetical protein